MTNDDKEKLVFQHDLDTRMANRGEQFELHKIALHDNYHARHEYARQVHAERMQFERNFKEYGQLALRSVFLLNAGAIITLMAFMGAALNKDATRFKVAPAMFSDALTAYILGLVATVLSLTMAYINYQLIYITTAAPADLANHIIKSEEEYPVGRKFHKAATVTAYISVLFGILGIICFIVGGWLVRGVFVGLALP